jgi:hypothetical protein
MARILCLGVGRVTRFLAMEEGKQENEIQKYLRIPDSNPTFRFYVSAQRLRR